MYELLIQHNTGTHRGHTDSTSPPVSATHLVTRRRLIGSLAAVGCLAHIPLAKAGVNLGRAPQMLGGLNQTAVNNAFNSMISAHYANISSVNLNASEWGILGLAYPHIYSLLTPTAQSHYVSRQKLFVCPPTLGCLGALDSTLNEIYLDFRLFGGPLYGALSLESAALATVVYYGGLVVAAYGVGSWIGSKAVDWMQVYTPNAWDRVVTLVGSTTEAASWLASSINQLANAAATSNNGAFGYDSWRLNLDFFDVPSSSLGIGGSLGFDNSYGWGVFDSISSADSLCLKLGNC
jgi:hypothetical protein